MRLEGFDYSSCGAYFVTICVSNRNAFLWENIGANCVRQNESPPLSNIGKTIDNEVQKLNSIYENVSVDKYCIMPDHIHIFIGMRPHQSISALVQNVKTESSKWINSHNLCSSHFNWQDGYGAFSYSKSHVPAVVRYILNQKLHHKKETFLEEYRKMLEVFGIAFDEQYIFKELESQSVPMERR